MERGTAILGPSATPRSPAPASRIFIVLTSHIRLGETGHATGYYIDEMATPYGALVDAGHAVDIASIQGGASVHHPSSLQADPSERPRRPLPRRPVGDDEARRHAPRRCGGGRLRAQEASFESVANFRPHPVRDGRLITGQNPASAGLVGEHLAAAPAESPTRLASE